MVTEKQIELALKLCLRIVPYLTYSECKELGYKQEMMFDTIPPMNDQLQLAKEILKDAFIYGVE